MIRRTGAAVVVTGIDSVDQAHWWRDIGADSGRGAALPVGGPSSTANPGFSGP
ncbi:MAG TPA: hypothetical protein VF003_07920 [Pseudonocardiaceae bacterium]